MNAPRPCCWCSSNSFKYVQDIPKKYPQAPMAIGRFCMKRLASSWSYAKASYDQFFWDALYSCGKKFKIRIISNEKLKNNFHVSLSLIQNIVWTITILVGQIWELTSVRCTEVQCTMWYILYSSTVYNVRTCTLIISVAHSTLSFVGE